MLNFGIIGMLEQRTYAQHSIVVQAYPADNHYRGVPEAPAAQKWIALTLLGLGSFAYSSYRFRKP